MMTMKALAVRDWLLRPRKEPVIDSSASSTDALFAPTTYPLPPIHSTTEAIKTEWKMEVAGFCLLLFFCKSDNQMASCLQSGQVRKSVCLYPQSRLRMGELPACAQSQVRKRWEWASLWTVQWFDKSTKISKSSQDHLGLSASGSKMWRVHEQAALSNWKELAS